MYEIYRICLQNPIWIPPTYIISSHLFINLSGCFTRLNRFLLINNKYLFWKFDLTKYYGFNIWLNDFISRKSVRKQYKPKVPTSFLGVLFLPSVFAVFFEIPSANHFFQGLYVIRNISQSRWHVFDVSKSIGDAVFTGFSPHGLPLFSNSLSANCRIWRHCTTWPSI